MKSVCIPEPLREKLHDAASDALVDMFAEAHRLATESFDRCLAEEMGKLRLDIANLRFELLKWSFLLWIGQVAALTAVFSLLLRAMR